MVICITFGGVKHCFHLPVYEPPFVFPRPGPGPINYPAFLADATIVASLHALTKKISDPNVREAAERGHSAALEGMRKHFGSEVTIQLSE
jgi:hypothetical protein